MKKERSVIVIGLIFSAFIVLLKIYAGMVFNSYLLMVSGYTTLVDMTICFLAFFGSVVRGRRASKSEPFGFGNLECFSMMLFGMIISILAVFIIVKSFFLNYNNTSLQILLVVSFIILFKYLESKFVFENAKSIQSNILMDLSSMALNDVFIIVMFSMLILLSSFNPIFDLVGSVIGGFIILVKGMKVFFNSLILVNGKNVKPKGILNKVKKMVNESGVLEYSNANLTSLDKNYRANIEVLISDNVSLKKIELAKWKVRWKIKTSKMGIRMVDFEVYKK